MFCPENWQKNILLNLRNIQNSCHYQVEIRQLSDVASRFEHSRGVIVKYMHIINNYLAIFSRSKINNVTFAKHDIQIIAIPNSWIFIRIIACCFFLAIALPRLRFEETILQILIWMQTHAISNSIRKKFCQINNSIA